ncbi:dATP/dGTP diphosphohydrolase domain-containing protein [Microvirga alba]|uniref:dATP/dGTP diphosphohydrolase N-terminal domain-containing protein n=1 Tax=Microvirga alba TaxID=2791025 RepID=A0A931BVM5_9HYPH|nr:dATP/dGTP diphosphohydrolase domain-containing protein [Microvirga alba]MBF9235548.1 hypothetical protein [Microvirga alba]
MDTKPTNPKDLIGSGKLPVHLWPETATVLGAMALLDGALKYGRSNFRAIGVRSSIYYDAARRHLAAWFEGEDADPDSGLPHLAHALASIAILVDAKAAGKLNDDRMIAGGYRQLIDGMTMHVQRLKDQHAARDPRHYTIADNPANDNAPGRALDAACTGIGCIMSGGCQHPEKCGRIGRCQG